MKKTPQLTSLSSRPAFLAGVLFSIFTLCISCNSDSDSSDVLVTEADDTTKEVHLALAGGGWRAHTGHAGWTMSLLDNGTSGSTTLDDVFKNVTTVSSNSGGSWFSTMLMYSDSFVNEIQTVDAIAKWKDNGWLGKQKTLFNSVYCPVPVNAAYSPCVLGRLLGDEVGYWKDVVEDVVYSGYSSGMQMPLSGTRQQWAADKPLLLASTMLTTEVVLSGAGSDVQYYQACPSYYKPEISGDGGYYGTSCGPAIPDVTGVTFSSVPGSSGLTAPNFFRGINSKNTHFNFGYTDNQYLDAKLETTTIDNPTTVDDVPVITAAATSSAAGGFIASTNISVYEDGYKIPRTWETAYRGEDEALSYQIKDSKVKYIDVDQVASTKTLKDDKVFKLADGGPVDNSGVTQLMHFLQLNKKDTAFNIIAFDNVTALHSPADNGAKVGVDIANLFGEGLAGGLYCAGKFCISVPQLQIFEANSLTGTKKPTWSTSKTVSGSDTLGNLIYTRYSVTTIKNDYMGITAGSTGTLHAFTCAWGAAGIVPQTKEFTALIDMLDFINTGLQDKNAKGKTGLQFLKEAFKLSN